MQRSHSVKKQQTQQENKSRTLQVRLSPSDWAAVEAKVDALGVPGLSRSAAARALLLGAAVPASPGTGSPEPRGLKEAAAQIGKAGNVLNQLARIANTAAQSGDVNGAVNAMMAGEKLGAARAELGRAADALERIAEGGGD